MKFQKTIILLIIVFLALLLALTSCTNTTKVSSITTDYGDTLLISVFEMDTMHHDFVQYDISNDLSSAFFYTKLETIPDEPLESFEHIIKTEDVHVYYLQHHFIFSYGEKLYVIPEDFNLTNYMAKVAIHANDIQSMECIQKGLEALCKTKKLKYIEKYDEILAYIDNPYIESLAHEWASGNISDNDDEKNRDDGYQKQDLKNWALTFLNQEIVLGNTGDGTVC